MIKPIKFSLTACRINADMTLPQAAQRLTELSGIKVSRQRVSQFENSPANIPTIWASLLAEAYDVPIDYIDFERMPVNQ